MNTNGHINILDDLERADALIRTLASAIEAALAYLENPDSELVNASEMTIDQRIVGVYGQLEFARATLAESGVG